MNPKTFPVIRTLSLILCTIMVWPLASAQQPDTLNPGTPVKLTLHDAELLAIRKHPRITIADLNALAAKQVTREVRSALLPVVGGNATGVTVSQEGNRISAGALGNSIVFERAGAGLFVSQLITDFGRTNNVVAAAGLNARAQDQNALATREQIVFTVDQTFYEALSAEVLVKVADQTVQARQVVVNQIEALEKAKLRSALDLSFAQVSLAQAELLQVNAKNSRDAAYANLSEALGLLSLQPFELVDSNPPQQALQDVNTAIQNALQNRPDLKALQLQQNSAQHLLTAEERLQLPEITALGAAGVTPVVGDPRLGPNNYGAIGVNVHIPIFNGFLFSARADEARLRTRAASEQVRDLQDTITRQVRVAWLNMNSAFQRESVAAKLLEQTTLSLNLAQARYNLGLGSIVELSQAQLQQTEAEINTVTAKYQYELTVSELAYRTGKQHSLIAAGTIRLLLRTSGLKVQPGGQLNLTGRLRAEYPAEVGCKGNSIGNIEIRMIQRIEELRTQSQTQPLAQDHFFLQSQIKIGEAGSKNDISSSIAESKGTGQRKGRSIKTARHTLAGTRIGVMQQIRTLCRSGAYVGLVCTQVHGKRRSALQNGNAACLPAMQHCPCKAMTTFEKRDGIDKVGHEAMAMVEAGKRFFRFEIVHILRQVGFKGCGARVRCIIERLRPRIVCREYQAVGKTPFALEYQCVKV